MAARDAFQKIKNQPHPMSASDSVLKSVGCRTNNVRPAEDHYYRARDLFRTKNQYKQADPAYQEASALAPTFTRCHSRPGARYQELERFDDAIPLAHNDFRQRSEDIVRTPASQISSHQKACPAA